MTWGAWIDHDNGPCPLPLGTHCELWLACGCVNATEIYPHAFYAKSIWPGAPGPMECDTCGDWKEKGEQLVMKYRLPVPKAMTVLRELVQNLPDEVKA